MFSTKKSKKTGTYTLTHVIRLSSFFLFSFSPYSPLRFSLLFSSFFPCFSPFIFLWFSLRFSTEKADKQRATPLMSNKAKSTNDKANERWAMPLIKNLILKEREKQSNGSEILEIVWIENFVGIVWIEKFVSWFWRLMGLRLRWWYQRWSQEGWRRW